MARIALLPMLAWAMLASGCCCPPLSGRYEPPTITGMDKQPIHGPPALSANTPDAHHGRHHRPRLGHRFGWRGFGNGPETPPGQHVPLPRFHPVPVRPVFEPQFEYSPPFAYGPTFAPIVTPESLPAPAPVPPVPDPE